MAPTFFSFGDYPAVLSQDIPGLSSNRLLFFWGKLKQMNINKHFIMRHNKYRRNKDTISGQLDDQLVMMDIEKGQYFSLNPVSTRIWELLERSRTMEEICITLTREFEIEPGQCRAEVEEHLREMKELGLIYVTT